jgi:hypothetical protein
MNHNESYSYLYFDSDDRENKELADVSNVTFRTNFRANDAKYLSLSSYDFVYAINNINENNRTAFIDTSIQTFQITLDTGNYNFTTLATQIQIQLVLAIVGTTCTFSNGVYTITSPVPIRFITNPANPTGRDWGDMIGMTKDGVRSLTLIGGIPDISYTNKLYIICDTANRFKDKADESSCNRINNCLGVVYVNPDLFMESPPDTIIQHHATRQIFNLKWIKHRAQEDIGTVGIYLLDDRGQRLPSDQLNKLHWSIEVIVK